MFVFRLRMQAAAKRATLDLDVARDVQIGKRVQVSLDAHSTGRLVLGPGCALHDDILILLRGGTITLGTNASVRRGSVLNISGELILEGDNIISFYNIIHCAERIRLARYASTNEFCTLVDSRHTHDGGEEFFYENVETAPIEIGKNVWMANKSSVLMGVTIGDDAVVAGHAVVHGDVPARAMVGGIPAKVIRQR